MKYLALGLLLLVGCPKKTVTVTCTWLSNGNPTVPVCGASPCLLNYTLTNQATGAVIATIPISATSYAFSASTAGLSGPATLGLAVNEQTASGIVSSPKALTVVPLP